MLIKKYNCEKTWNYYSTPSKIIGEVEMFKKEIIFSGNINNVQKKQIKNQLKKIVNKTKKGEKTNGKNKNSLCY